MSNCPTRGVWCQITLPEGRTPRGKGYLTQTRGLTPSRGSNSVINQILYLIKHLAHYTLQSFPQQLWGGGVFHGPLFSGDCKIAWPHNGGTSRPHQHNSTLDVATQNTHGVGKLSEAKAKKGAFPRADQVFLAEKII